MKMKKHNLNFLFICVMFLPGLVSAQATNCDFWGQATYEGNPIGSGDVIKAYDPNGVECGTAHQLSDGWYAIHVDGDDPSTPGVDEGAVEGNSITFKINGKTATVVSGSDTWTNNGSLQCDLNVPPPTETISKPGTPSGETNPTQGTSYSYSTSGATSNLGHTVEYQFNWGDGTSSSWSTSTSASHSWSTTGSKTVTVTARCQDHTDKTNTSDGLSVTVQATETISKPGTPSGQLYPTVSESYTYSTSGATSNLGHTVEYQFNWGDGTSSSWSTSTSASHSWSTTGSKTVTVTARCKDHTDKTNTSDGLSVTVEDPETISKPGTPTGNTSPARGVSSTYSTTGATSSLGHTLEYQFNWGDGTNSGWSTLTSASHIWSSNGSKTITVTARCQIHPGRTNTSDGLIVTVVDPPETISKPGIPAGELYPSRGVSHTYTTTGATSNLGHTIEYQFNWGDGTSSGWSMSKSASHSWSVNGSKTITVTARCQSHNDKTNTSDGLVVTVEDPETISKPGTPSGETSAIKGQTYTYSTTGATSNVGHTLEYRFDWNDGSTSDWSTSTSASHSWSTTGTKNVTVTARCSIHPTRTSISDPLSVTVEEPSETISKPGTPSGEASPNMNVSYSYTSTGATSNLGHTIEYSFGWGDGSSSDWSTSLNADHSWTTTGSKIITVTARCQEHPSIFNTSDGFEVIVNELEIISQPGVPDGELYPTVNIEYTYTTSGAVSNLGHAIEYQFNWGDGIHSPWSISKAASHAWSTIGTKTITVTARCQTHQDKTSISESVIITVESPETISKPGTPSGEIYPQKDVSSIYSTSGATSNVGHPIEYQFYWDDGTSSNWSSDPSAYHDWSDIGKKIIFVIARCQIHHEKMNISDGLNIDVVENTNNVDVDNDVIQTFNLFQNFPNPFNPSTTIKYEIPKPAYVNIYVANSMGQKVRKLVCDFKQSGIYEIQWDGRNDMGFKVGSGIFFVFMKAGDFQKIRKIQMIK